MNQNAALLIYRELLRASRRSEYLFFIHDLMHSPSIHSAFKGDHLALNTVHTEIRNQFFLHKNVSSSEVDSKLNDAKEALAFINENIVQARKKDCGTLEVANVEDAQKLERMQRDEKQMQ